MKHPITGLILVLFGVYTVLARHENPNKAQGLAGLRDALGERAGYAVHLVVVSLVPLLLGSWLLLDAFDIDLARLRFGPAPPPPPLSAEEQARRDRASAILRLVRAGLRVEELEDGAIVAREPGFTAGVAKIDAVWRVVCPKREPVDAASFERATLELLACRDAFSEAETPPPRPSSR